MWHSVARAWSVLCTLRAEGLNRGRNKFSAFIIAAASSVLLLSTACSVNVKKEANGQDKQVDINTFAGGIHVSKQADVSDIGLAVYPGARLKEKESDRSDKSANVNISGFGFGLKVVALQYESHAAPAKILAFYKDQLKKYGNVLECHSSKGNWKGNMGKTASDELTAEGTGGKDKDKDIELKAGKKHDQHIVAIKPEDKGSRFTLGYLRTHGKSADI